MSLSSNKIPMWCTCIPILSKLNNQIALPWCMTCSTTKLYLNGQVNASGFSQRSKRESESRNTVSKKSNFEKKMTAWVTSISEMFQSNKKYQGRGFSLFWLHEIEQNQKIYKNPPPPPPQERIENPTPQSFFAPKPHRNTYHAGYKCMNEQFNYFL